MNAFSGRKGSATAGSFRRVSARTVLAISGCGLAVLIAAAAAAQRPEERPAGSIHAGAPGPVPPAIPRLRQQWPAASLNAPARNPFAFAEAAPGRSEGSALETAAAPVPADIAPTPPRMPQLIGILADAAPEGPRYRAVLITAQGDLWFAAEGDSRDGFTVRHLTGESADIADGESAPAAHLALP